MKRRIVWINLGLALLLVVTGVGAYLWLFSPSDAVATTGRTVGVQKGTISETVTATGTVATSGTLKLSFAAGGTVDRVNVAVGQKVKAGKVLATIDDAAARQSVANARSSVVQAASSRQQGAVSVTQAQASVSQAATALANAKSNAELNTASYQQAVDKAASDLATAKESWSDACLDPAGTCSNPDAWAQLRAAEADVASARTAYDQAVQNASANETTNSIKLHQAQVDLSAAQAKQDTECSTYGSTSQQCTSAVDAVRSAQQQLELTQNSTDTAGTQSQQTLVNADARITTANITLRKLQGSLQKAGFTAVRTAKEALSAATLNQEKGLASDRQAIEKAQENLVNAQLAVTAVQTGSASASSTAAQAAVARAGLTVAEKALADTKLTAPVSGTVASVDLTQGQSTQAGTAVMTLIPKAPYEITASFSEADALKVKVGQKASVTFDALPGVTATGTVTALDLVSTTGSNVTTYGVTITLDESDQSLKDGMSASVVVTTDTATDVLWAPTAAITTAGGQSTVTVRKDGKDTITPVTTGLAGDTGTEITSGVTAGDQLVISTSDSSGTSGFPMGGVPGGGVAVIDGGGPPAGAPSGQG